MTRSHLRLVEPTITASPELIAYLIRFIESSKNGRTFICLTDAAYKLKTHFPRPSGPDLITINVPQSPSTQHGTRVEILREREVNVRKEAQKR
jgi:hypothetical protein